MFENEFEKMLNQYRESIDDKKKFTGLIKDFFHNPEDVKAVNLILIAYELGIVEDLNKASKINNTLAFRYVKQMMDDYGLSRVNADWIVAVWCVCYGERTLGKPCDIKFQEQSSGPAIREEQNTNTGKKYGDLFSYKPSSYAKGISVAGFSGSMRQTVIFQNYHEGKPVVDIGDNLFAEEQIEEAIITDGIAFVGEKSFFGCKKLHQAVLPTSIKEIGDSCFEGCENLKSVSLPERLERVGENAFKGSGLKTISIPKSVYWIGDGVFSECPEINNITIPANIDKLSESMFEGCTSLKKISLHNQLERIEDRAFFGCSSLDFIVIPDSVTFIGENSFTGTDKRFIVQCSFGSYAEEYCRKNKVKYQLV